MAKYYTMLDLVLQAWGINWMNHYLIPAPLPYKLAAELEQCQSTIFL